MTEEPDPDLLARAEAGDGEAQNDVGRFYGERGRGQQAALWFRRAAELGLPKAKHNLGLIALQGGQRDEAVTWFNAAAQDGWMNSVVALGMLREQDGDITAAIACYERAAEHGHDDGQDALARLALDLDTDQGYERARQLSELAADQGNASAHARLGGIYHEGLGVKRDPKRAAEHWLIAAQAGHPGAQVLIGNAYIMGAGVPVDRVKATYFLALGACRGDDWAEACLQRLLRELTPEEMRQAEEIGRKLDYPLRRPGARQDASGWRHRLRGLWDRFSS